jgi:(R)-amidase
MHIVLGFAERQDEKIYNTAIIISNQGRIIQKYRKVHCRDFESAEHDGVFSSGSDFFVSKIDCRQTSLNAGLMICFDREIPESARCLRKLGAEFIFCPLATNTSKMTNYTDHINNEMITRCRAAENELYIAVVNHAKRFNGGSFVVGPTGELVCQLDQNPQVKILEIPVELVRQKFHSNPLGWMGLGYSRPEIYKKYGSLES